MPRETRPKRRTCCAGGPAPQPLPQPRHAPVLQITSDTEAARLWKHAMIGTVTCVSLITQYAVAGMPGMPRDQIKGLRDMLNRLLTNAES